MASQKLLEVGKIFQRLYEKQRHPEAIHLMRTLVQLDKRLGSPRRTQNLLTLYRLNQGPIATTLENKREPFLPVDPVQPGKNVYPWGVKKEEIDAFLSANPDKREEYSGAASGGPKSNSKKPSRRCGPAYQQSGAGFSSRRIEGRPTSASGREAKHEAQTDVRRKRSMHCRIRSTIPMPTNWSRRTSY